jgi:phenylacetate-CoA ligase
MDFNQIRNKLIAAAQADLSNHLNRLSWTPEQLQAFQLTRLRQLLTLAKTKTVWYHHHLAHIDPATFTLDQLSSLPTLTKAQVMQHWNELVTIPGLMLNIAENHLEQLRKGKKENPFFNNQYLFIATGGSSGTRGLYIWDLDFLKETACINYRFLIHDEIKANYHGPKKLATIEAPTLLHGSQHLFTINVASDIAIKALNVVDTLEKNSKLLEAFQPTYLVGFASYITALAHAQLQGKLSIQPRWVSTNSELLTDDMRAVIQQAWGIKPCNSWGSVEIGSVAMENKVHDGMIIAEDGVILELVDDYLRPVTSSAYASKVLATSLFNHCMPLIRYVIEDVIDISHYSRDFPAYHVIPSVLGRTTDWFQYENCCIPPIAFRDILSLSREVYEYQILQTPEGAIFKLICHNQPNINEIEQRTKKNLQQAGLKNPRIVIEVVTNLPKNPETGKVKRFIPLKR